MSRPAAEGLIYFHGQPGAPGELAVASPGQTLPAALFAPDRAAYRPELPLAQALDQLAGEIGRRFPQGPIRLVGFSLGGFIALETALRLEAAGRPELSLDLVSAAAPLDCGDVLPAMAGRAVFTLARDRPRLFALLTRAQGWMARRAPAFLLRQIFADAAGADADLARDPVFQAALAAILVHSLGGDARGYRREVLAYVAWPTSRLAALRAPVTLWQGEADTWTPPAMADALATALPNVVAVRRFEDLSHYSTLRRALPEILGAAAV